MNARQIQEFVFGDWGAWVFRSVMGLLVAMITFYTAQINAAINGVDTRLRTLEITVAGSYITRQELLTMVRDLREEIKDLQNDTRSR